MKIFKNRVGRPSNEIIKKRRNFCIVLIIISICVLGIGVYFAKDRFLNKDVESNNKNIGSGSVSLTATDANGKAYKSGTWATKVNLVAGKPSSKGVVFGYTWYKDGKEYSSCKTNTCIINTSQSGTFKVKVRVERKVYYSSSINVKVDPNKISSVSVSSYITRTSSEFNLQASVSPSKSTSGYKYQWYKGTTPINGENSLKLYSATYGEYKFKVTTGAGASKTQTIDICKVEVKGGSEYMWFNKDVSLKYTAYGPIKSFKWYKDGKEYSACNGKTTCKLTSNQNSNYCVKATSKNGKELSSCNRVKIDKSTINNVKLYLNGEQVNTKLYREGVVNYGSTIKAGTKITVKPLDSYCSKYDKDYKVKWYSGTLHKNVSTSATYTPAKGVYEVFINNCNGGIYLNINVG